MSTPLTGLWQDPPRADDDYQYTRWLTTRLDTAARACTATAAQWTRWAAELAALRHRPPALPALLDADGIEHTAVTGAFGVEGLDPDALRADLTRVLTVADHAVAVHARHADLLDDALGELLEHTYPPPRDPAGTSSDPAQQSATADQTAAGHPSTQESSR